MIYRCRLVTAMWRMIAKHAANQPPYATSLDVYRELREVTPAPLQPLLGDLIEHNTFWELKTNRATSRQTPGGWQVSLDVVARKVVVDESGAETPGKPLYLTKHRIRTGPQTIAITVPQRPARAGIDPRHLLLDVEPGDNLMGVEGSR